MTAASVAAVLVLSASVAGAAPSEFAIAHDLEIDAEVSGDAVVLAGDLRLGPSARIHGDAVALIGSVEADPDAVVEGRVLSLPSLATLTPVSTRFGLGVDVRPGLFLLIAGWWLLATSTVAIIWPQTLRREITAFVRLGSRVFFIGLVALVTIGAALVAVMGLGPVWGVPLAWAILVGFLIFKVAGLAVLGGWLGGAMIEAVPALALPLSCRVFLGTALFLVIRMLPAVGGIAWNFISILALGVGFAAIIGAASHRRDDSAGSLLLTD